MFYHTRLLRFITLSSWSSAVYSKLFICGVFQHEEPVLWLSRYQLCVQQFSSIHICLGVRARLHRLKSQFHKTVHTSDATCRSQASLGLLRLLGYKSRVPMALLWGPVVCQNGSENTGKHFYWRGTIQEQPNGREASYWSGSGMQRASRPSLDTLPSQQVQMFSNLNFESLGSSF